MNKMIKQFEFENWSNTLILNTLKKLKETDDRLHNGWRK